MRVLNKSISGQAPQGRLYGMTRENGADVRRIVSSIFSLSPSRERSEHWTFFMVFLKKYRKANDHIRPPSSFVHLFTCRLNLLQILSCRANFHLHIRNQLHQFLLIFRPCEVNTNDQFVEIRDRR